MIDSYEHIFFLWKRVLSAESLICLKGAWLAMVALEIFYDEIKQIRAACLGKFPPKPRADVTVVSHATGFVHGDSNQ